MKYREGDESNVGPSENYGMLHLRVSWSNGRVPWESPVHTVESITFSFDLYTILQSRLFSSWVSLTSQRTSHFESFVSKGGSRNFTGFDPSMSLYEPILTHGAKRIPWCPVHSVKLDPKPTCNPETGITRIKTPRKTTTAFQR